MTPAISRARGRASATVKLAWLKVAGAWLCSTEDPSFELIADDGARIRIRIDPDTGWEGFTRHLIGGGPEDDDFDREHPFRGRDDLASATEYLAIDIPADTGIEVWGAPEFALAAAGYRDTHRGALTSLAAVRVASHDPRDERLESRLVPVMGLGLALALAIGTSVLHLWLARAALIVAVASARGLHRASSPLGPTERVPKHAVVASLLLVWFWSYVSLGYVLPGTGPFRLAAGVLLAAALVRWGVITLRQDRIAMIDLLLSPEAVDGIVHRDSVLLPTTTLAPSDIATAWTPSLATWEKTAAGAMSKHGITISHGDHARAVRSSSGWILARSYVPTIAATLRRARAWDRAMPGVYFALAAAALTLSLS